MERRRSLRVILSRQREHGLAEPRPARRSTDDALGAAGRGRCRTGRRPSSPSGAARHRLATRLTALAERDRQWTACEIHDGLVQQATAAQMYLSSLLARGDLPGETREYVAKAERLVGQAIREARRLIRGLRPAAFEAAGLVEAIEQLVAEQDPDGPHVKFTADLRRKRFDRLVESNVYRIVQEGLANARRHSRSDVVEIRLEEAGDRLIVRIQDWGVGFDPARVTKNRFGLLGIRERTRLLRGRVAIDGAPGKGTRILVEIPLAGPGLASSTSLAPIMGAVR